MTTKPLFKSIDKVSKKRQTEIVLLPHKHIWRACLQDITIDHQAAVQELDALMVDASPEEVDGYTGQRMLVMGLITAIGSGMSAILAGSTTMSPA